MVGVTRTAEDAFVPRPTSLPVWLTAGCALVAAAVSATAPAATVLGVLGFVLMPVAVQRGSYRLHTLGALVLFSAVLAAGIAGTGPQPMLVAAAAAVVAWDAGENAIGLGKQVGSHARMRRAVLAHTMSTVGVAVVIGGVGFTVYRLARAGQPTTAVVLLLVAAVLFTVLFDR